MTVTRYLQMFLLNVSTGELTSEITADEILAECGFIDIDIYDETLVVSTNKSRDKRVLFYKINN